MIVILKLAIVYEWRRYELPELVSSLLLTIVDDLLKLLHEFLILLFLPGRICTLNTILHLLQRLLKHRREVAVHLVNVARQFLDFILLLCLKLFFRLLDRLLLLLESFDLFLVCFRGLLEHDLTLPELFIRRLVLARHVSDDGILAFPHRVLGLFQLHLAVCALLLSAFRSVGLL